MFGKKTEQLLPLDTSLDRSSNIISSSSSVSSSTSIAKKHSHSNSQFIFYQDDTTTNIKFTTQIELYAILNNTQSKTLVVVDNTASLDFLSLKIAEAFDSFPEYRNLDGLKAINLSKQNDKSKNIPLPTNAQLQDCIINGDVIYCDLKTNEYWIHTIITITIDGKQHLIKTLHVSMDFKVRLDCTFKKFKLVIIKSALNSFVDYLHQQHNFELNLLHYIVKKITFTCESQGELELNDPRNNKTDEMKIENLFDFKSEIKCDIDIRIIEEMLFTKLKDIIVDSTDVSNNIRNEEFRQLSFDFLNETRKFKPEKKFIYNYVKMLINGKEKDDLLRKMSLIFNGSSDNSNHTHKNKVPVRNVDIDEQQFTNNNNNNSSNNNSRQQGNLSLQSNDKNFTIKLCIIITPHKQQSLLVDFNNIPSLYNVDPTIPKDKTESEFAGSSLLKPSSLHNNLEGNPMKEFEYEKQFAKRTSSFASFTDDNKPLEINALKRPDISVKKRLNKFRATSLYSNLCNEFNTKLNKEDFILSLCTAYRIDINRNTFDKIKLFEFREFKITTNENRTSDNDASLLIDSKLEQQVKKNNIEILVFVILMIVFNLLLFYNISYFKFKS